VTALELVVVALATYRVTRLVTADRITERLRVWVEKRGTMLGYLVTCDWCLSVWVAPAPTALALWFPGNRLVALVLVALAASGVTGLLSLVESRLDR
jgi:hypothetical protein